MKKLQEDKYFFFVKSKKKMIKLSEKIDVIPWCKEKKKMFLKFKWEKKIDVNFIKKKEKKCAKEKPCQ